MSSEFSDCAGMGVEIGNTVDTLGEKLGEGAEGAVYRLEQTDDRVAKIFKRRKREKKQNKIRQMVQDSMIAPDDQESDIPWTAWPVELVSRSSDGSFLGYMMPYLDTNKHIDAQRYASKELRWGKSSRREQYKPAVNLTLTVHWLHQNGYAVGDLSEQNVRVNSGTVTLIDCDSYAVKGSDFTGQMEAPRYTPPEGRGESYQEVKKTDKFGVAVHIFQFLMAGFHPYQAVGEQAVDGPLPEAIQRGDFPYGRSASQGLSPPPRAPDFDRLPQSIRRGFERSFSRGLKNPTARPSLQEWLRILSDESDFEVGGVDTEDKGGKQETERLSPNWQREIRQEGTDRQTASKADQGRTEGTTTASSSGNESHWADDIRADETDLADSTTAQSDQIQMFESDAWSLVGWALLVLFMFVLIALVFL